MTELTFLAVSATSPLPEGIVTFSRNGALRRRHRRSGRECVVAGGSEPTLNVAVAPEMDA